MATFVFTEGDRFIHCGQWGSYMNGRVGTILRIVRNNYGRIDHIRVKWDDVPEMGDRISEVLFNEALKSFRPMSLCHRCVHRLERMASPARCRGKTFTPLPGIWQDYWQERISDNTKEKKEDELSQDLF